MHGRALDHPLEAGGRLRIGGGIRDQIFEFVVDIARHVRTQVVHVHGAGAQHGDAIPVLGEGKQKMLERRQLVLPRLGIRERPMQGLFEGLGQHGLSPSRG